MPVHPEVQQILDYLAAEGGPPAEERSVAENRELIRALSESAVGPEVARVEALTVADGVPARVYRPPLPASDPPPLLVWFHGGGWVIGDLDTADPTARDLCAGTGFVVVSVDYPLAPEHPFPAAPEACWSATSWLAQHAGELGAAADRIAVAGDSAGANLAAVTTLLARDRGGPTIGFQLLVYPVTDLLATYPSIRENGEGYLLTRNMMEWFTGHYLGGDGGDGAASEPTASPIYAGDLAGLPPALVITAEFDPLRDEGEAYAERLRLAGVPTTTSRYDGMIHGFFAMTAIAEDARRAVAEAVAALRQVMLR